MVDTLRLSANISKHIRQRILLINEPEPEHKNNIVHIKPYNLKK